MQHKFIQRKAKLFYRLIGIQTISEFQALGNLAIMV